MTKISDRIKSARHCEAFPYSRGLLLLVFLLTVVTPRFLNGQDKHFYAEKIFLHTDREYYISGEYIHFKAYLSTASGQEVRSQVLYVEVSGFNRNSNDCPAFRIEGNTVAGQVRLPDSLKSGYYILTAYTNWHKNFENRYAFRKELVVINRFGNNGTLHRDFRETITPLQNQQAYISVQDSQDYFYIRLPQEMQYAECRYDILSRGKVTRHRLITDKTGKVSSFRLNKTELPGGLVKISIRAGDKPVFSTFVENIKNPVSLLVNTDKKEYSTRNPVQVSIELNGLPGGPAKADLSLAVFPVPAGYALMPPASLSDWFVTHSELSHVADISLHPPYPVISTAKGESSWVFDEIKNNHMNYPVETDGRIISGKVVDKNTGTVIPGTMVFFSFIDTLAYLDYDLTDSLGIFFFSIPASLRADPGIVQVWDSPAGVENSMIRFDSPEIMAPPHRQLPADHPTGELSDIFAQQVKTYELSNMFTATPPPALPNNSSAYIFETMYKGYAMSVYPSDFVKLTNFSEIVKEILPGVRLRTGKEGMSFRIMDEFRTTYFDSDPLVLVNGLPLKNCNYLANLSSDDIERIDVVRRLFAVGSLVFPGVLSVKLNGSLQAGQLPANSLYPVQSRIITQQPGPLYPQYDDGPPKSHRQPDLRNTLFWEPTILTGSPDTVISFYTSDLTGKYLISVEGLVNDTIPVSATTEILITPNY